LGYTWAAEVSGTDYALCFGAGGQTGDNDPGVAWIDFNAGAASFASGALTISSAGVLGGSGIATWLGALTNGIDIESDSVGVQFGAANDASIVFDGNSLNIKANNVTAGDTIELQSNTTITTNLTVNGQIKGNHYTSAGTKLANGTYTIFDGSGTGTTDGTITITDGLVTGYTTGGIFIP
jgi:hypothetical protein